MNIIDEYKRTDGQLDADDLSVIKDMKALENVLDRSPESAALALLVSELRETNSLLDGIMTALRDISMR